MYKWKSSFVLGLLVITTVIVLSSWYYLKSDLRKQYLNESAQLLKVASRELLSEMLAHKNEVQFLANTPPISGLVRAYQNNDVDLIDGTTSALWSNRLEQIFYAYLSNHTDYFQLRVLLANGQEEIKVTSNQGSTNILSKTQMQNKSDRDYFKAGMQNPPNIISFSSITLNREFGQIEMPYKPTLRVTYPIYTNNQIYGLLIANIDISAILKQVVSNASNLQNIIITDEQGFYIWHFNDQLRYSRDLAPSHNINTDYQIDSSTVSTQKTLTSVKGLSNLFGHGKTYNISSYGEGSRLFLGVFKQESEYQSALLARFQNWLLIIVVFIGLSGSIIWYFLATAEKAKISAADSEASKKVIDSSQDGVLICNADGKVLEVNKAFCRFSFRSESELLDNFIQQIMSNCFNFDIDMLFKRVFSQKEVDFNISKLIDTPLHLRGKILVIDHEKTRMLFAILVTDVSKELESARLIEQQNERLEDEVLERTKELEVARNQALKASEIKSQFISTISHEMRTPLNGISGSIQLLKRNGINKAGEEYVNIAERGIDTLNALVNDVLDISKIEAGKLDINYEATELFELFDTLASTFYVSVIEKGLNFYLDTSKLAYKSADIDSFRLRQVITNLIHNSVKFTSNGYIKLTISSELFNNKAMIVITVTDTGIGISPQDQENLFQDFSQANSKVAEQYGGTGLGLSICKQIVMLMDGDIHIDSKEGKYSTFSLHIPLTNAIPLSDKERNLLENKEILIWVKDPQVEQITQNFVSSHGGKYKTIQQTEELTQTMNNKDYFITDGSSVNQVKEYFKKIENKRIKIVVITDSNQQNIGKISETSSLELPLLRADFVNVLVDKKIEDKAKLVANKGVQNKPSITNTKEMLFADFPATLKEVLVVDDNKINRKIATFMLESLGLVVSAAINGQHALDVLNDTPRQFSLIFMDCNMPTLNGYDTAGAIRQGAAGDRYSNITIIAMTANAMKGERDKCLNAGMTDYLTKPLNLELLTSKITPYLIACAEM